ncbi:DUF2934 domain-containing protein [Caballeronia sp. S22]|uniref:DUF2934 domain-containing protein n=1 Tax=Caballeronia sp. S22 TaxID=3137182 RepID=UPI003530721D
MTGAHAGSAQPQRGKTWTFASPKTRSSCAYQLWTEAGCPEGRADEFWQRAQLQLGVIEKPTQSDLVEDSDEFAAAPAAPSSP